MLLLMTKYEINIYFLHQHLNAFNQGQTDGTAVIKYGCCQRHGLFKRISVSFAYILL
jgi:hypothetical protein